MSNVIVLLCFGLMTSSLCSESPDIIELWLEDYTRSKNSNDNIQSDSPPDLSDEEPWEYECPVVPKDDVTKSTLLCLQPTCESDLDCDWPVYKCCQNGCLQTCLEGVPPPPYVDWRREPQRDPVTGISWLIKDPPNDDVKTDKNETNEVLISTHMAERCEIDNTLYSDGSQFIHRSYKCKCHKGLIYCNVDTRKRK